MTLQERFLLIHTIRLVEHDNTIKVVGDEEKESKIVATDHEHREDVEDGTNRWTVVKWNNKPTEDEKES